MHLLRRRAFWVVAIVAVCAAAGAYFLWPKSVPRMSGPLEQEVYVWQRAWSPPVCQAVRERGPNFGRVVVLAAEVAWKKDRPTIVRPHVNWASLDKQKTGLAVRVGAFGGSYSAEAEPARVLVDLCAAAIDEAKVAGVNPVELQIDFDCAESKLAGYRTWVEAIRKRVAPVPVTITVLPSWLDRSEFVKLAQATDGFVLQVHSLERPKSADAQMALCDPAAARRAVEQAARAGVKFRVALPTYGYLAAFDASGKFVGLSAEGPAPSWGEGVKTRRVDADAAAMAELVNTWTASRPANMSGVIWYRLPNDDDVMNWRWPTLAAVMQGRAPAGEIRVEKRKPEPGLIELELVNAGDGDAPLPSVDLQWHGAKVVSVDAIGGFERRATAQSMQLSPGSAAGASRLAPGERRAIGWIRFDSDTEVAAHVLP